MAKGEQMLTKGGNSRGVKMLGRKRACQAFYGGTGVRYLELKWRLQGVTRLPKELCGPPRRFPILLVGGEIVSEEQYMPKEEGCGEILPEGWHQRGQEVR